MILCVLLPDCHKYCRNRAWQMAQSLINRAFQGVRMIYSEKSNTFSWLKNQLWTGSRNAPGGVYMQSVMGWITYPSSQTNKKGSWYEASSKFFKKTKRDWNILDVRFSDSQSSQNWNCLDEIRHTPTIHTIISIKRSNFGFCGIDGQFTIEHRNHEI